VAYIDPEGMFGGERMALLSDSAKFSFPWFWCASNTVGRVELSYSFFLRGPFRQFRKPPTETQFWKWVSELHEAYLLFVYQVNGQAWGQWDVSERYLPDYKLKSDLRSPVPDGASFNEWRGSYQTKKIDTLSSKCRIFSNSKNFQKIPEDSPMERRGNGSGEELTHSSAADAAAVGADASAVPIASKELPPDPPKSADEPTGAVELSGLFAVQDLPPDVTVRDHWFMANHDAWYLGAFWNHCGKIASRKAYVKCARKLMREHGMTPPEAVQFLWDQAIADKARFLGTNDWAWRQNLHPATWLNGERWEDQARAPDTQFSVLHKTKQELNAEGWDRA
jgi:hypothetical protein